MQHFLGQAPLWIFILQWLQRTTQGTSTFYQITPPGGSLTWSPASGRRLFMEEWNRFDHTVAALSKEVIQLCFNAVSRIQAMKSPIPIWRRPPTAAYPHQVPAYQTVAGCQAFGQPSPHPASGVQLPCRNGVATIIRDPLGIFFVGDGIL
jgi:hypothetical protein